MPIIAHDRRCARQPLISDRLVLRDLRRADIPALVRHAGNLDVANMSARIPHPYTNADAEAFLNTVEAARRNGDEIIRAITCGSDDALVGVISLRVDPAANSGTLGYWLAKPLWNHGYLAEAAQRVLRHGFEDLGLRIVRASTRLDNPASLRVLQKIGMVPVSTGREDAPARAASIDVELRSISRAQWFAEYTIPVVLVSAVALIDPDNRVLLARRPPGKSMAGLWEFPGGKVMSHETPEAALIRELREELAIDTAASCFAPLTFASHRYDRFHLLMPLFVCRVWSGTPTPLEGQELAWVRASRLRNFDMPPADVGLVAVLRDLL